MLVAENISDLWNAFINNISFELHDKSVVDSHYPYFTNGKREINGVSVKSTREKGRPGLKYWKSQILCAFSTILLSLTVIKIWTFMRKEDNPLNSYLICLLSDFRFFSPSSTAKVLDSASCFCFLCLSVLFA